MNLKHLLTVCLTVSTSAFSYGQSAEEADQLFLINGEQQSVVVKKVEPTTITYSFMGEDLENVVNKDEVAKIVFKNGREQVFSEIASSASNSPNEGYTYPPMEEDQGAILPFEFVFDGEASPEEGIQAQEYYYSNLMRKPERNTIGYQDPETTQQRLREVGIASPDDLKAYPMSEVAQILGVGTLVTGKIVVKYQRTTSQSSESSTVKVDEKKKKVKNYTSEYNTSEDEFTTRVTFKIYDKNGEKIMEESRMPFMGANRDSYVSTLSYLMKRTPFYQK